MREYDTNPSKEVRGYDFSRLVYHMDFENLTQLKSISV